MHCPSNSTVFLYILKDCITTDGVRVNCLCPEFVDTRLVRESLNQATPEVKSFMLETIGLLRYNNIAVIN